MEVLRLLAQFLPAWRQANDLSRLHWSLLYCAHGFARLGEPEFACKVVSGSRSMTERDQLTYDELVDELADRLGTERFDELVRLGEATPIRDLAEEVLQKIDQYS